MVFKKVFYLFRLIAVAKITHNKAFVREISGIFLLERDILDKKDSLRINYQIL